MKFKNAMRRKMSKRSSLRYLTELDKAHTLPLILITYHFL